VWIEAYSRATPRHAPWRACIQVRAGRGCSWRFSHTGPTQSPAHPRALRMPNTLFTISTSFLVLCFLTNHLPRFLFSTCMRAAAVSLWACLDGGLVTTWCAGFRTDTWRLISRFLDGASVAQVGRTSTVCSQLASDSIVWFELLGRDFGTGASSSTPSALGTSHPLQLYKQRYLRVFPVDSVWRFYPVGFPTWPSAVRLPCPYLASVAHVVCSCPALP
jgi:hypothetical protein